ncbi:hypothetical protein Osc7112_6852 (plasmid) [Oscillatoria nigro-viridis PCC 7112]|uniref:Uncharacterized protein n=1 Tax=Phormidium nigroviride PCC 7112 TaxID=179408 RepID=K9VUS2_9CYAN|nr:tyrosine-type recombinase/integrase [Oscillatoria nigro-viridis]AFZ10935.1 hypothetical protein Osc7112_6852 [Oscillatoria nigro-viridis PCC 7112]
MDEKELPEAPPQNLFEFWQKFLGQLGSKSPSYIPMSYTVITRVIAPYLGGPVPQKERATEKERAKALSFLKQRPISDLKIVLQNAEHFFDEQGWKEANKRKQFKFHLNNMVKFAVSRKWFQSDPENLELIYCLKEAPGGRKREDMKDFHAGLRTSSETVFLGCLDTDFVSIPKDQVGKIWLNWRFVLSPVGLSMLQVAFAQVEPNWYLANPEFDREIMEFAEFMEKKLRVKHPTVEADVQHVCRLLGWMFRKKKEELLLAEVRLAKVVPFTQMKFKLTECLEEGNLHAHKVRMYKEGVAQETSEDLGKEAANLIEEYVEWGNVSHASVVQNYNAIINLAKFTYYRQVSSEDLKSRDTFDKIPLINVLKACRRVHERETRKQAKTTSEKRSLVVPYPQIIEVLEKTRFEATLEVKHYQRSNRYRGGRPQIDKIPRMDTGIARSFQRFIIIALMVSCPPRRAKEYYEAEIGKSLVKGGFQDGSFVSLEKMKNPNEAQYYLWPEDYKTMGTYGELAIPLNNITFPDGTRFYDYLEMWINKWRQVLAKEPKHNFLFLQDKNGKLLNSSSFGKKVKHIFWRFAGVSMSPHKLRHSFETYSQEIGLSDAEKQASVLAMGHSSGASHFGTYIKLKVDR